MCGIVGYIGKRPCAEILLDGLKRLEYRGYDSAGIAVINNEQRMQSVRAEGKLHLLSEKLATRPLTGTTGIGHTRWATHGVPSERNAHPHLAGSIAVVHNGIIENHNALREQLRADGIEALSDTDTEIAAHLIHQFLQQTKDLKSAVCAALKKIHGSYALVVIDEKDPDRIIAAKQSSPLVIGFGQDEMFCASDIPAVLSHTRTILALEDGEVAELRTDGVFVSDLQGETISRAPRQVDWSPVMAEKEGYKHFMLKEIHEQPRAVEDTLRGRIDIDRGEINATEIGLSEVNVENFRRVVLLACGTSYHAALIARYYFEAIAKIPTMVELASEFRNRDAIVNNEDLVIAISQSGETLDTLMAAKEAKNKGAYLLAIANVIDSAIPRIANGCFYTHAGPEIGVASTKCFTVQLVAVLLLSMFMAKGRNVVTQQEIRDLISALTHLPQLMRQTLAEVEPSVAELAKQHVEATDVLFLGRGLSFPIALEGALKLKEISYIHAEGYAAGEMKHGPIALIDANVPVVVVAPKDKQYEKTLANLQEAHARQGVIIAVVSEHADEIEALGATQIVVPQTIDPLTPLITVIPLQMFSYYTADHKGTDVDQPRNLAKTVTVE